MSDTLTLAVGRYAASTSVDRLPSEVKERAKQVIFDEIACSYFGRRSLAGDLGARYAAQAGGPAEARIYATGQRVSAPNAALANGAAGHGEEVDGAHVVGGHPGASIVHAAVAMAERQRATGAELLNAVVLGYDVGVRVVEACGKLFGVKNRFGLNSDFLYAFGCTAAASRLLGLDALRHCHSIALTSFATNSPGAFYAEKRHISKSLCNGQFASAGVSGALMAGAGLEGHEDTLGAPYGVLHAWGVEGQWDAVTRGLGEQFAIMGANFKFLNAGYPIHAPVEAALNLVAQHGIRPEAIEAVDVGMPTNTMKVVDSRTMHNICLQDMLSAAIVQGGLKLRESPFPEVLADPAFARLRPRVTLRGHPDLDRDQPDGRGSIVTISTADGKSVSARVDHPRGHSKRGGVTWPELARKWHEGLPECDVDRLVALAQGMEDIADVNELLDALRAVR
ncbi:MAG TPA: MmgE/PrpD family protein [Ramlibacter sp.]|nr:MmgE/PrpD family protein [Ramlibacter sp.]